VTGVSHPNAIALSTHNVGLTADGSRLTVFAGYQVLRLDGAVRIMFNRHVTASHVSFTLDGSFERLDEAPAARPLRFRPVLRAPWS